MNDSNYPLGAAYIEGKYVPMSEAKISVLDWGFLRSDATYDVVHVWENRFFRLDLHVQRFLNSVEKLRLSLPFPPQDLVGILKQCVLRSKLENAYVEMILTRGVSPTFSRDPRDAINNFIAFAIPFGWIANESQRSKGLDIHIASVERIHPNSVDPTIKNYHWLDLVKGLYEAYDHQRENVVLIDGKGNVTEGPGFNIFSVKNGVITTPATGVLEGITRQTAMELASELEIQTYQRDLRIDELLNSDEVFITSTAGGIIPVCRINGNAIGSGKPGTTSQQLIDLYWLKHDDPTWTTGVKD